MTARPPQRHTVGVVDAEPEIVTYYHGYANVYSPSLTSPGASSYYTVSCAHRHGTRAAAEQCGRLLAAAEARQQSAQFAAEVAGQPCHIESHRDEMFGEVRWLRWCATHGNFESALHSGQAAADASTWRCPWDAR